MKLSGRIEELRQLLDYGMSSAKQMLSDHGEFYPFGAMVNREGMLEGVGGDLGREYPSSQELYKFLEGHFRTLRKEKRIVACALVSNVNIPREIDCPLADGIRVHLETDGYCRYLYVPYRKLPHRALRKFIGFLPLVEYHEEITVDVPPVIF